MNSFRPEKYKNIGLDQLVVFSADRIIKSGEECTFERLVYECFTLFPEVFGLLRYPDWPDSSRVNKSWLRCRTDKGWLAGTTKEGFRLTQKGKEIAKDTMEKLASSKKINFGKAKKTKSTRERHEAIIYFIEESIVFKKFAANLADTITESEFITFLGGTLETPKRILRHNLNLYINAIELYKKQEMVEFLNFCKERIIKIEE
jgi:hypothetical protein